MKITVKSNNGDIVMSCVGIDNIRIEEDDNVLSKKDISLQEKSERDNYMYNILIMLELVLPLTEGEHRLNWLKKYYGVESPIYLEKSALPKCLAHLEKRHNEANKSIKEI